MRNLFLIIAVVSLTSCATIVSQFPSVQHCQKVKYERDHSEVHIEADCDLKKEPM